MAKIPAIKGNIADPKFPAEKVNPKTVPSFSGYIFDREVTRGVPKSPDPRPKTIQANIKKLKLEENEKRIIPRAPIRMLKVRILRSPKLSEKIPAGNWTTEYAIHIIVIAPPAAVKDRSYSRITPGKITGITRRIPKTKNQPNATETRTLLLLSFLKFWRCEPKLCGDIEEGMMELKLDKKRAYEEIMHSST